MSPRGGGLPVGDLAEALARDFDSIEGFKKAFTEAASGQFGSGWTWLAYRQGRLEITSTSNAKTPVTAGLPALLTCDVWEHAYYLDYQNDREEFVSTFLDNLVNWDFVAQRLREADAAAKSRDAA